MLQPEVKKIIRKRADELGVSYAQADEAYFALFEWLVLNIREGEFPDIGSFKNTYIKGFATFGTGRALPQRAERYKAKLETDQDETTKP